MTERNRRHRTEAPETENGGRFLIQMIICATLICGFMFFKDTPICGTTVQRVANHFINYTVNLSETLSKFTESVIPANGTIEQTEGN